MWCITNTNSSLEQKWRFNSAEYLEVDDVLCLSCNTHWIYLRTFLSSSAFVNWQPAPFVWDGCCEIVWCQSDLLCLITWCVSTKVRSLWKHARGIRPVKVRDGRLISPVQLSRARQNRQEKQERREREDGYGSVVQRGAPGWPPTPGAHPHGRAPVPPDRYPQPARAPARGQGEPRGVPLAPPGLPAFPAEALGAGPRGGDGAEGVPGRHRPEQQDHLHAPHHPLPHRPARHCVLHGPATHRKRRFGHEARYAQDGVLRPQRSPRAPDSGHQAERGHSHLPGQTAPVPGQADPGPLLPQAHADGGAENPDGDV